MSKSVSRNRKLDHIALAMEGKWQTLISPGWDSVALTAVALPNLDPGQINIGTDFLNHHLKAPIMIAGMTGGHAQTENINANLAIAANECGIAIGVGSQRAALQDSSVESSYAIVRKNAPNVYICGNIGISQLVDGTINKASANRMVDMIDANSIAVHINILQELIQPEGEITLSKALPALEQFVSFCPVPVLVKETGCGLDALTARRLVEIGISALDVGGAGGTSFVQIEGVRAKRAGEIRKARLAQTFSDWGVPTVTCVNETVGTGLPIIATGGIRNGLDVAKAIAIGADLAGIGRQILKAAIRGPRQAVEEIETIIEELTIAMVLTESGDIQSLRTNHLNKKADLAKGGRDS